MIRSMSGPHQQALGLVHDLASVRCIPVVLQAGHKKQREAAGSMRSQVCKAVHKGSKAVVLMRGL